MTTISNSEIRNIPLDQLEFDPENPRLPLNIDGSNYDQVIEYLISEANIPELMMSIGEQGYFIGEPLLVVESKDSKFIVVEGNRRLCALKLLKSDSNPPKAAKRIQTIRESANSKPDLIPCQIFHHRSEILSYLGYRHITGVNEWNAIAKARYLTQLYEKEHHDNPNLTQDQICQRLAKIIASRSDVVAKLLTGLKILEYADNTKILSSIEKTADTIPFSLITTALGYPNLREFIGLTSVKDFDLKSIKHQELKDFFEWSFGLPGIPSKLGESRNYDMLARIVKNETALTKFYRGSSIEEADLFTEGPIQAFRNLVTNAKACLENAQDSMALINDFEQQDLEIANLIKNLGSQIHSSIKTRLNDE